MNYIKKVVLCITLVLLTFTNVETANSQSISKSRKNAITKAVDKVSKAVAGINVTSVKTYSIYRDPFFDQFFPHLRRKKKVTSVGSGAVISPDGYIVTNHHVIENAKKIVVTLPPGKEYKAKLVGKDSATDIALLKIDIQDAEYIKFGDSDEVILGEWSIALGNPFGLFSVGNNPSVTVGVVSSLNMDFGAQRSGHVYQDMIQTDASINTGNSGGPLVNAEGKLIGINTFIFTGGDRSEGSVGVGFAIPSKRVKRVVEKLKDEGEIDRSFETGLGVQSLSSSMADYLGLENSQGVIVRQIKKNSPADKCGFKVGDVIVKVGNKSVRTPQTIRDYILTHYLSSGDKLKFTVIRDDKRKKLILELG